MSSAIKLTKKMFNKLLKQYGTTLNIDYANKNSMGQFVDQGVYQNVKVLIDPIGEGLNYENQKFGNIKSAKAVFYLPVSYKVTNYDTGETYDVAIDLKSKQYIKFTLPDGFSYTIAAVSPIVAVGNEVLYQVGVQG